MVSDSGAPWGVLLIADEPPAQAHDKPWETATRAVESALTHFARHQGQQVTSVGDLERAASAIFFFEIFGGAAPFNCFKCAK